MIILYLSFIRLPSVTYPFATPSFIYPFSVFGFGLNDAPITCEQGCPGRRTDGQRVQVVQNDSMICQPDRIKPFRGDVTKKW